MNHLENIFCINLKKDIARKENIEKQSKELGLPIEFIPGIELSEGAHKLTKGQLGCKLAHKKCIDLAIARGLENVLILEDDVELCKDFKERFDKFLSLAPKNWDILALGYSSTSKDGKFPHKKLVKSSNMNGVYKLTQFWGGHAYYLNKRSLKIISNYHKELPGWRADWVLNWKMCPHHNVYGYYPCFAKQISFGSNIENSKEGTKADFEKRVEDTTNTWLSFCICYKDYE